MTETIKWTKPLTDAEHGEHVRARLAAATVGPWRWSNTGGKVYLQGARTRIVMAFRRMGMSDAQPQMIRDPHGRLVLDDLGRENINEYPDALLIAQAPADLARLLARAEKAERERDQYRGLANAAQATIARQEDNIQDLREQLERERSPAHTCLACMAMCENLRAHFTTQHPDLRWCELLVPLPDWADSSDGARWQRWFEEHDLDIKRIPVPAQIVCDDSANTITVEYVRQPMERGPDEIVVRDRHVVHLDAPAGAMPFPGGDVL